MISHLTKSGIPVFFVPTTSQLFSVIVAVRAGAFVEDVYNFPYGTAHYLEHCMLNGSKNFTNKKELTNLILENGGRYNAKTSMHHTMYWAQVCDNDFQNALEFMREVLLNPLFDKTRVEKEQDIIKNEITHSKSITEKREQSSIRTLYIQEKRYAVPIIGTKESVSTISYTDIISYYKKFYGRENIAVFISGPRDIETYIQDCERLVFGDTESIVAVPENLTIQNNTVQQIVDLRKNTTQEHVKYRIAIPLDNLTIRDKATLQLVSNYLMSSNFSTLSNSAREINQLVYAVHVSYIDFTTAFGVFEIECTCKVEDISAVKELVVVILENMALTNMPEHSMKSLKKQANFWLQIAQEKSFEQLEFLVSMWVRYGEVITREEYFEVIQSIGDQDIIVVCKKLLESTMVEVMID